MGDMAGRQSHGRAPDKKPKAAKNNSKKRSLDAFAIASHENPDRMKVRQSRLGAQEGGSSRPNKNKRRRDEDDEDEEEEEEEDLSTKKRKVQKGRFDELDVDEGSDSEGNEWKMGQVDSDDDSDLDSDEAFGESDEERFEGFAFSGGQDKKKKKAKRDRDVNLDEEDEEDSDSELEEGDLGDDAVDMATYLDMVDAEEAEEREAAKGKGQKREKDTDEDMFGSESEEDSEESDEDQSSEFSSDEDDDALNPEKIAALDQMIESIPQDGDYREAAAKRRNDYNITSNAISMSGLPSSKKKKISQDVVVADSTVKEPKTSKKKLAPSKVPLEKRQQDRLDRSAAYEKSKETLDRWTDTVKHNRRADHLMFPLQDNEVASAHSNKSLMPANLSKPFNELEATIQSILEESGLATADGKDDEDKIREFEELETKKMSLEEVKERRDQLRMARELMFREEAKAKRIKKIKSKSYRKVHRKQREKQDRRRAEERMGAKHRESKWAKAMKGTGRAAWDEDARSGITEMARREEELRKRVEGRAVRKEFENDSDESLNDSDDDSNEDDDSGTRKRLLQNLNGLGDSDLMDESLPGARLANMDFMRKADAARRKQNNAAAEELRRELAGEETPSEEEDGDIGRRIFGPGSHATSQKKAAKLDEFEERVDSDDEDSLDRPVNGTDKTLIKTSTPASKTSSQPLSKSIPKSKPERQTEGGAWSKITSKSSVVGEAEAKRRRHKKNDAIDVEELDLSQAALVASKPKSAKKSSKKGNKSTVLNDALSGSDSDSENEDDSGPYLPFALRDQDLIKRAFAGADVVGEFEVEKKQTIEDEEDKVVDNTLPGWGSWVGEGVSKKENAKNKGRFLTKVDGIKADKRKDAKLDKVIINEKRVKKNSKYLATSLPHTFETQQQYERALRLPIGPQWSTKETFQDATKPRVLVKQGIIAPMSKPLF